MTQNLTSRRTVAGRFDLLAAAPPAPARVPRAAMAVAAWCLSSCLFSAPAFAQHSGGHPPPLATGNPGAMMGNPGMRAAPPGNPGMHAGPGHFERPTLDSHGQPRMGLQLGLGGRWWDDHGTVHKLKLNTEQQHHMDAIFEVNKPTLITLYTNLQREQMGLANLSHADLQDETKVFAAIDRVTQARSDLEKENAHILLQLRQQLDPQQLETLDRQIASSH